MVNSGSYVGNEALGVVEGWHKNTFQRCRGIWVLLMTGLLRLKGAGGRRIELVALVDCSYGEIVLGR